MRKKKFRTMILLTLLFFTHGNIKSINPQDSFQKNFHHAQTYYWLAIDEQGNLKSFDEASEYLLKAKDELNKIENHTVKATYLSQIESLENDIICQKDMHHDTFYGYFPLARLLQSNIFIDASSLKNYELVDDPSVIAVCNATESFKNYFNTKLQIDVIFNSIPENRALENESRYVIKEIPKLYIHNYSEVIEVLNPKEIEQFNKNEISPTIIKKLFNAFKPTNLLIITIIEGDIVNNNYFYHVKGALFNKSSLIASFKNVGFCRDKRDKVNAIILINIFFLFLGIILFAFFSKLSDINIKLFESKSIIIAIIGFLFGRFIPWILIPLIMPFSPVPENLAVLSYWWLVLFGIVTFHGVMLVFWIVSMRLKKLIPIFSLEGKLVQACIAVSLGVSAYMAELYVINSDTNILYIIYLIASMISIAYLTGKTLSHSLPYTFIIVPMIFSASLGIVILTANQMQLLIVTLSIIIFSIFSISLHNFFKKKKKIRERGTDDEITYNKEGKPETISGLISFAEYPTYLQLEYFKKTEYFTSEIEQNKFSFIGFVAPSGRGKTATAKEIISILQTNKNISKLEILKGKCPDSQTEETAIYAPFKQILGDYFNLNFFTTAQENISSIDSMLGGVLDGVVPFAGLLFPADSEATLAGSKEEMKISVYMMLRKLAKKHQIIIYIDDLQWIDSESSDLLKYLIDRFKIAKETNIGFISTSHDNIILKEYGITQEQIVNIPEPTIDDKIKILTQSLGLEDATAVKLLSHIGSGINREGGLFYLLKVIANLAREKVFDTSTKGFIMSSKYKNFKELPVPRGYSEALEKQLNKIPDKRQILECAACIGMVFNANLLAESLEQNRLDLLRKLDFIEKETGLIFDVKETDDNYSFHSSFTLKILRENLIINQRGPSNNEVPQIIREYHARIATSLEKTLGTSSNSLFDVAKHYFAAGAGYAKKALEYCVKSAYSASVNFSHNDAKKFMEMASEIAEITGKTADIEEDFIIIQCNESHIEGITENQIAAVDICNRYLESHDSISDKLLTVITRTFYNAATASRDKFYFQKTVEYGKKLLKRDNSVLQAEGHQFIALGLNPWEKRDEIISHLNEGVKLLETHEQDDLPAQRILARLYDSLAGNLTYTANEEDKERAEKLYTMSVLIKENPKIHDMPGLARSYGGWGRLILEKGNPIIEEAINHFQKDLEISTQIGDMKGISQIYSHLGECSLLNENFVEAMKCYEKSYEESGKNLNNKLFAIHGYFTSILSTNQVNRVTEFGTELVRIIDDKPEIFSGHILNLYREICDNSKMNSFKDKTWFIEFTNAIQKRKE